MVKVRWLTQACHISWTWVLWRRSWTCRVSTGPAAGPNAGPEPLFSTRSCSGRTRLSLPFCLQESQSFPESYPELPKKDTVESCQLQKHVLELAAMLEVQNLFWEEPLETY